MNAYEELNDLRPIYDAVHRRPTTDNVAVLRNYLGLLSPQLLQKVQGFILVPLVSQIQNNDES